MVATQTPRHDNQLVVVTFDDDSDQISSTSYFHSAGEVWYVTVHLARIRNQYMKAVPSFAQPFRGLCLCLHLRRNLAFFLLRALRLVKIVFDVVAE